MITEEHEYDTWFPEPEPGAPVSAEPGGKRWLELRRRIERRHELKRLRDLLDDPTIEDLD